MRFAAMIMIVGCHPQYGPDRAFAGHELHRRCASLPSGDGMVATAAVASYDMEMEEASSSEAACGDLHEVSPSEGVIITYKPCKPAQIQ
ncbi:hypothetical protein LWI29_007891 [Acer saccharum]|uniref:Uncharacterized protein n=1 Tax=Acer saccharum TaxID=4024 RepID=A0AA39W8M0_ACESA|nr:hypothetical protein LWI29_007891 [Acer saccharum]